MEENVEIFKNKRAKEKSKRIKVFALSRHSSVGRTLASGARGRRFDSYCFDQKKENCQSHDSFYYGRNWVMFTVTNNRK